jgi:hypothetical protein
MLKTFVINSDDSRQPETLRVWFLRDFYSYLPSVIASSMEIDIVSWSVQNSNVFDNFWSVPLFWNVPPLSCVQKPIFHWHGRTWPTMKSDGSLRSLVHSSPTLNSLTWTGERRKPRWVQHYSMTKHRPRSESNPSWYVISSFVLNSSNFPSNFSLLFKPRWSASYEFASIWEGWDCVFPRPVGCRPCIDSNHTCRGCRGGTDGSFSRGSAMGWMCTPRRFFVLFPLTYS